MTMMTTARVATEPGVGTVEIFPMATDEAALFALLTEVFENWWDKVAFGTLVQGAVYEIHAPNAPRRIGLMDGYATVDFGSWHFHICIGPHKGAARSPVDEELAHQRRTARCEMIRVLRDDGTPRSWQLRMFNGKDENQLTVFLPHPYLGANDRVERDPTWERLSMWDSFRKRYLELDPDPLDRQAHGFPCGG